MCPDESGPALTASPETSLRPRAGSPAGVFPCRAFPAGDFRPGRERPPPPGPPADRTSFPLVFPAHAVNLRRSTVGFVICLAASWSAPAALRAGPNSASENPAGTLTLRQALRLTLLQNPELAAADSARRVAEGRLLQAGLRPNPSLFTEADNLVGTGGYRETGGAEYTLQLSQLVELGGKRAARLRVAARGRELTGFDHEAKRLDVLVAATRAFVQTLAAQRRQAVAAESSRLAGELVPAIQRRVEAGAANAVEATRAQNAVATARIEVQQAARDLATARQRLAAGWGALAPRFASAVGDLERLPPVPSFPALVAGLDGNPAVARFGAETAQRQAELLQAQSEAVPDVTVALGPRYLAETNDAAVRLNVSLPLPLFDRNQGNVRAARAELVRTGQLQQATATQLTVAVHDAYRALVAARQEAATLQGTLIPGAEVAFGQVNEGYAAGRFGLLDLLDTRRTLVAARLQLLQAQAAYHVALTEVEGLTGRVRQAPPAAATPHPHPYPNSPTRP